MKVIITYDYWWTATLEVDQSQETIDQMEWQLLFWSGGKDMIDDEEGDIRTAYLKMLGREMISMSIQNWNVLGMISEFEEKEGWGRLDGHNGVKLLEISNWEFDVKDFDLEWKDE